MSPPARPPFVEDEAGDGAPCIVPPLHKNAVMESATGGRMERGFFALVFADALVKATMYPTLEMKMKNVLSKTIGGLVLAATTVAAAPPTPADAGTLEADYVDFARSGVFDPQLSNAEAMELVSRGLFSGNPRLDS